MCIYNLHLNAAERKLAAGSMFGGWTLSWNINCPLGTRAVKKAAPEDLKALIEKVDCFIFDCDGRRCGSTMRPWCAR